jgi:hypothetical protein
MSRLCRGSGGGSVVDKLLKILKMYIQSNTPLSVYDTKPESTNAPSENDTQIVAALDINVTLLSKKGNFIGAVALVVLEVVGIVLLLVAILVVVEQPIKQVYDASA